MLNFRQIRHLADAIGFSRHHLSEVAEHATDYCEELILLDPAKPGKLRPVLSVVGSLRSIQNRLLRRIFMPRLQISPYSHGGVPGRHIKSNAEAHLNSVFVFTADISNFYPTVSRNRIYRLCIEQWGCTPDVARILTMLCTHNHHLALGLVTSPFLAEQVLLPVDRRVAATCGRARLTYTRYVDDITISGSFDLEKRGFAASVSAILGEHGFEMHPDKIVYGRLSEGTSITKVTIRNGHPDVRREYLNELHRQIDDAINLAYDREFAGPYYTENQLAGRVRFVCWLNHGRRKQLLRKFNSIPWKKVSENAFRRGLVAEKKRLIKAEC